VLRDAYDERMSMNRVEARQPIETYVDAWATQNVDRFLSALADGVIVIECDGSAVRGLDEARAWFESLHAEPIGGRVTRWKIGRFLCDESTEAAAIEWEFGCTCYGAEAAFHGVSVVVFEAGRIARIHEYKRESSGSEAQPGEKGHG